MFQLITFIFITVFISQNNAIDYELAPLPERINRSSQIKINFKNNTGKQIIIERFALIGKPPDDEEYEVFSNFFYPCYKQRTPESSYIKVPAQSNLDVILPSISSALNERNKKFKKPRRKSKSSIDVKYITYRIYVYFTIGGEMHSCEYKSKCIVSTPFKTIQEKME